MGPVGPTGATGATGSPGVLATAAVASDFDPIAGNSFSFEFIGPVVPVTTLAGQRVTTTLTAVLGLPASTPAQRIDFGICYRSAGSSLSPSPMQLWLTTDVTSTRSSLTAAASSNLGAGNWEVGFCVRNTGSATISNNDWVIGYLYLSN